MKQSSEHLAVTKAERQTLTTGGEGRAAYDADVSKRPLYHDGAKRKTWEQLGDVARWSWGRA
jgi:hypothetical protein